MRRRPPRSTRTDTRFPYTTLFLSAEIAALGEAYLSRKRSFPVRTREELAALFEDAGFALECFADLEDANPGDSRPVGPTMPGGATYVTLRSEEHTTELQSLMSISYAVFFLQKKKRKNYTQQTI